MKPRNPFHAGQIVTYENGVDCIVATPHNPRARWITFHWPDSTSDRKPAKRFRPIRETL